MARQSSAVRAPDKTGESHNRRSSGRRTSPRNAPRNFEAGGTQKTYPVIFEKSRTGYSAYSPDVPGCGAAARTLSGIRKLIKEALEFHFEGMAKDGDTLPEPTGHAEDVTVRLPVIRRRKAS